MLIEDRSRKVDNVDFGFSFPSSARSRRSVTKTPQQRRSESRQRSKTPIVQTPSLQPRQSSSDIRNREISTGPGQDELPEQDIQTADGRSAKRRRLSRTQPVTTPGAPSLVPTLPRPGLSRASTRKNSQIFTIAEDVDAQEINDYISTSDAQTGADKPQRLQPSGPEDENIVSDKQVMEETATNTFVEQREAVRRSLAGANTTLADDDSASDDADSGLDDADSDDPGEDDQGKAVEQSLVHSSALQSPGVESSRAKKRKKRKLVVLGRKKKRLSDQSHSLLTDQAEESTVQNDVSDGEAHSEPLVDVSNAALETTPGSEAAPTPEPRRRATLLLERTPDGEDEEEDETYVQESSVEPPTPAPVKKPRQGNRRPNSEKLPKEQGRSKSTKPTFPILTHRMTNFGSLPIISEEGEAGGEGEEQPADHQNPGNDPFHQRAQPNVVDVLAQICRETITNLVEDLSKNGSRTGRATIQNKRSALEAFGRDLDEELFQMSEALENRLGLEARVRKARREKSRLQTEYMEIRKQRENIALKCDAVRRKHWECEEDTREKWQLSEAARRVELELERDEGDEVEEGVDFLLQTVAHDVSRNSDEGGILDKVRAFNSQLESLAHLLERR